MQNAERRRKGKRKPWSRAWLTICTCALGGTLVAQAPFVPPDAWGDEYHSAMAYRKNNGQVRGTDGQPQPTIKYHSERSPVGIALKTKSEVSYTMVAFHGDSITPDTLYRVDQQLLGGRERDPLPHDDLTDLANYYLADVVAEGVPAANRVYYHSVYDSVDVHYYHGSSGPRISFVIRPGGDPGEIKLGFTGQDSLGIDWQGALRLYLEGRWFNFQEAVAYQVDSVGAIIPVNWTATFFHQQGTAFVGFTVDTYDTDKALVLQVGYPPLMGGGGNPTLGWSTLIGTSGETGAAEFITAGAGDDGGNLYIAGNTTDQSFPLITGSSLHYGNHDVYFGKFKYAPGDPLNDARRDWMTYFGGGGDDKPVVAYFDGLTEAQLIVAGWTNSTNMSIVPDNDPDDGSFYQATIKGGVDGFILSANPITGVLDRSTYYGGEGSEMITAITQDADGNILLGGATTSTTGSYGANCTSPTTGFPLCTTHNDAHQQTTNAGGTDGFMLRLDPDFNLTWSTFFGGEGDDHIYDAAFMHGGNNPAGHFTAFVGGTTDDLPFTVTGGFHLSTSADRSGFIITFNMNTRISWGTHLHEVPWLEGVAAVKERLFVMGRTKADPVIVNTCNAVPGSLSICDPGNGAHQDDNVISWDLYFAEFDLPSGELNWATCLGDEGAFGSLFDEDEDHAAVHLYQTWQYQPFPIFRFSDLKTDPDDRLYALALFQHGAFGVNDFLYTVPQYGYYNQDWNPNTAQNQSDIALMLFSSQRQLLWLTLYGGGFDQVDPDDPFGFDLAWQQKGCEFGSDLVLIPDQCLYWVGKSGGMALPEACPYPGISWCEQSLTVVGNNLDPMQGFVARMNLVGLSVGLSDPISSHSTGLVCYPNPTTGNLQFDLDGQLPHGTTAQVIDALGRIVLLASLTGNQLDVNMLSQGVYQVRLVQRDGKTLGETRFIKQ